MDVEVGIDLYSIRFQNWTIDKMIDFAYENGFRKIAIDLNLLMNLKPDGLCFILDKINNYKLKIHTTGVALLPNILLQNIINNDAIESHIKNLLNCIKINQKIGSRYFRTYVLESGYEKYINRNNERSMILEKSFYILAEIIKCVSDSKATLLLENHQDLNAEDLLYLINEMNKKYCGICFDFGNQIAVAEHPIGALEILKKRVVMVHLKDIIIKKTNNGYVWRAVPLGMGCIPIKKLLSEILCYNMSVEIFLEISTSRPPIAVDLNKSCNSKIIISKNFIEFLSQCNKNWSPEIDSFYSRGFATDQEIANQEINHFKQSKIWIENLLRSEGIVQHDKY